MLRASARDKRISFERRGGEEDDHGESVGAWAPVANSARWAAVFYGRSDERREAAREGGSQAANFVVFDDSLTRTITIRDRIQFGGAWDIKGVSPDGREIGFSAVRAT